MRAIPLRYQDHRNTVTEISVIGEVELARHLRNPEERVRRGEQPFTTVTEEDELLIRIGDPLNWLARGTQRWTVRYRLGDVAMNSPDRTKQEIYLDANGTGWSVPFDRVWPNARARRTGGAPGREPVPVIAVPRAPAIRVTSPPLRPDPRSPPGQSQVAAVTVDPRG